MENKRALENVSIFIVCMVWRAERFITLIVAFFYLWCVIVETVERCTRDLLVTVVYYVKRAKRQK